jgi:hypothetical protein
VVGREVPAQVRDLLFALVKRLACARLLHRIRGSSA